MLLLLLLRTRPVVRSKSAWEPNFGRKPRRTRFKDPTDTFPTIIVPIHGRIYAAVYTIRWQKRPLQLRRRLFPLQFMRVEKNRVCLAPKKTAAGQPVPGDVNAGQPMDIGQ